MAVGEVEAILTHRRMRSLLLASAVAAAFGLWRASPEALAIQVLVSPGPSGSSDAQAMPLAAVNEEFQEWLAQADSLLANGNVTEAVRAYQALVVKGQRVVHQVAPGLFVSISKVASTRIGGLDAEAMTVYHRLYDAQAEQLYRQAVAEMDRAVLRRVIAHYYHTSAGDRALDFLGSLQFDRGRYAQAARSWQRVLDRRSGTSLRPELMLAKAAVAWHLAGVPSIRDKRIGELRTGYPEAVAMLAGREQNVLAFVLSSCRLPPPAPVVPVTRHWPGLGGVPDGLAVMEDCDVALAHGWRLPAKKEDVTKTPELASVVGLMVTGASSPAGWSVRGAGALKATIDRGRISATLPDRRDTKRIWVPCVTHPVVAGSAVLVRSQEHVIARDLLTGEEIWRSCRLPVVRDPSSGNVVQHVRYFPLQPVGDLGRYGLTVGGDLVLAVSDFLPAADSHVLRFLGRGGKQQSDHSRLVALSLSRQGRLVWEVGAGRGESTVLKEGKFLCAPTYAEGRVYAVVKFTGSFHLVCLDALEGGKLVWSAVIGQAPAPEGRGMILGALQAPGSPPAVSQGRVFATTNAGLIAAFDADTGRNLWMRQYGGGLRGHRDYRDLLRGGDSPSPNPMIVRGGKLIAYPTDSVDVIAMNVDDGTVAWRHPAAGQRVLSALPAGRVLLSGPGLDVVDAADGATVWQGPARTKVFGRPAVTKSAVLASALGGLLRIDLGTGNRFEVRRIQLPRDDSLLGNLVSCDGKLVAGGAGTVSVYAPFDRAYEALTARLKGATGEALTTGRFERGRMAYKAAKLTTALEDFDAVAQYAALAGDGELAERIRPWLARTYIGLGNGAADAEETYRWFRQASDAARTPAERGEMIVRLIRHHERVGRWDEAARLAQQLAEKFADVLLRDVPIGPTAKDPEALRAVKGEGLGQRHVGRLIEQHGPKVYALFDAKAKAALDAGLAAGEPDGLLAASQRYPHSQWADDVLLAAAEILYDRGVAGGPPGESALRRAMRALYKLEAYSESPLALSGLVGQALIQMRLNPRVALIVHGGSFAGVEKGTRVKFGAFDGRIDELILKLTAAAEAPSPAANGAWVEPPLREIYRRQDPVLRVLRDDEGRALRIGQCVMLLRGGRVVCLDTDQDDFDPAVRWEGFAGLDARKTAAKPDRRSRRRVVGHLVDDGRKLVVTDMTSLTVLDTAGGRALDSEKLAALGVTAVDTIACHRKGLLFGAGRGGVVWCVTVGRQGRSALAWSVRDVDNRGELVLQAAGRYALVVNPEKSVRCYDLRTGRIRLEVLARGKGRFDAALTDDGRVVVLRGTELSMYDVPERPDAVEPTWRIDVGGIRAQILAVGAEHVAVSVIDREVGRGRLPPRRVKLVKIAGPERPLELPVNKRHVPIVADVEGDTLIVSYAGTRSRPPTAYMSPAVGVCDMRLGEMIWGPVALKYKPAATTRMCGAAPARQHVIAMHEPLGRTYGLHWYVLDRKTGRVVQDGKVSPADNVDVQQAKLKGRGRALAPGAIVRRPGIQAGAVGPAVPDYPVVTGGRLLIEYAGGIVLLGGGGAS